MKNKRPLHINPLMIRLPLAGIVSILHRVAGILVFLLIPLLLWALQRSLVSPEGLNQVSDCLATPFWRSIIWILLAAFAFHFLAGIRHLLMDLHIGESRQAARSSAYSVIGLAAIVIAMMTYWLWRE